jgi:hypothetical protein
VACCCSTWLGQMRTTIVDEKEPRSTSGPYAPGNVTADTLPAFA